MWERVACRGLKELFFKSPPTASLLKFRVKEERPVKHAGID